MLTTPDLVRIVNKLMVVCVTFSNFIQVCRCLVKSKHSFTNTILGNNSIKSSCPSYHSDEKGGDSQNNNNNKTNEYKKTFQ